VLLLVDLILRRVPLEPHSQDYANGLVSQWLTRAQRPSPGASRVWSKGTESRHRGGEGGEEVAGKGMGELPGDGHRAV
jgi:hypothetical protein